MLGDDLVWFGPIRTKPKRTYDGYGPPEFSPEGEHTPFLLRRILGGKDKGRAFLDAVAEFGKESGLFRGVRVKRHGAEAAAPFELLIELESGCELRVNNVGYGVSQVLPLLVEMLSRKKGCWFAIQQPEVHLHPRAQAAAGDLIFHLAEHDEKHFLIETHSDFIVDRFRLNFKKFPKHKTSAQVLFFERSPKGNTVTPIPICDNGEYPEEQPRAFRDFFMKEAMSVLGLENVHGD
jgi:predicted ATPase